MENQFNNHLIVKNVDFEGYKLKSAQDKETQKIYVGISWVCNGLGLSKSQKDTQVQKIQTDDVLSKGCLKFQAGVFDENNNTLAIDIEFLPLWLAKITITPRMKADKPQVVEKLIDYQLKAKDVLARAFLYGEFDLPMDYKSALSQLILMCDKNNQLKSENQQLLPKVQEYDSFMNSHGNYSVNQVANMLGQGEYIFFAMLRDSKILRYENGDNVPYGRFRKSGHFITVATVDPRGYNHTKTYITPKGLSYLCKRFKLSLSEGTVA